MILSLLLVEIPLQGVMIIKIEVLSLDGTMERELKQDFLVLMIVMDTLVLFQMLQIQVKFLLVLWEIFKQQTSVVI
jgi:hypothetical protein